MKHLSRRFIPVMIAASTLLFAACATKGTREIDPEFARYISAFTYGNVSTDAFIQVELAQEVPAVELNDEISEPLFSFSPSLKGKAFWVNGSTIRFMPEAGELQPGKEYNITFHLGKVLKVDDKFQRFHFPIRVNEQNFTADILPYSPMSTSDLTWNTVEIMLNLSNPATTDDISHLFHVNEKRHDRVRVMPAGASSFRVLIDSLQRSDKPEQHVITIDGNAI